MFLFILINQLVGKFRILFFDQKELFNPYPILKSNFGRISLEAT